MCTCFASGVTSFPSTITLPLFITTVPCADETNCVPLILIRVAKELPLFDHKDYLSLTASGSHAEHANTYGRTVGAPPNEGSAVRL